jgi:hypothetical protein
MNLQLPKHIHDDIVQQVPKAEYEQYYEFVGLYYKKLVSAGVFLSDVKFTELSWKAKRTVFFGALELWKKSREDIKTGIL